MHTIEQLCNGVDPSVVLVCQSEALDLLSHSRTGKRSTQHQASDAFWWPLLPAEWEALRDKHWRLADMVYTHTWRQHQIERLKQRETQTGASSSSSGGLFELFEYNLGGAVEGTM